MDRRLHTTAGHRNADSTDPRLRKRIVKRATAPSTLAAGPLGAVASPTENVACRDSASTERGPYPADSDASINRSLAARERRLIRASSRSAADRSSTEITTASSTGRRLRV